ncbi:hypothetical protein PENSPDRAFT_84648 [Peniophora sp. CONT]|nr:hypothetical protein PENSPDRAFT_84648 [Peniophora sp. CONT]
MQVAQPCDFANVPPHPLIYASLIPSRSPHLLRRMDLHRPKTKYTVGRGPLNDFVLDEERSGQIGMSQAHLAHQTNNVMHRLDSLHPVERRGWQRSYSR